MSYSEGDREWGSEPSPVPDWSHKINVSVSEGSDVDEVEKINERVADHGFSNGSQTTVEHHVEVSNTDALPGEEINHCVNTLCLGQVDVGDEIVIALHV